MKLLTKIDNQVLLQVLCDALDGQHIAWRVDGAFGTALGPGTGLFSPRIFVDEKDLELSRQIMADLEIEGDLDGESGV